MMRNVINQHGEYIKKLDTVYIGYDPREQDAVTVLIDSIERNASRPINIITLNQVSLRRSGLYRRSPHVDSTVWGDTSSNTMIDMFDEKPFSTEFSFSRFLIPFLNQHEGFALFMDCDMYFRGDVCELFDEYAKKDSPAIQCVQHQYSDGGKISIKMYGCPQTFYSRKNWSSFVLWNCGHEAHLNLTVDDVNTKPGRWLHNFLWIENKDIGSLPEEWNWLDGHSSEDIDAKNVHFTTGGPWFDRWEAKRDVNRKYAEEWKQLKNNLCI
jgi:hypothetical protein